MRIIFLLFLISLVGCTKKQTPIQAENTPKPFSSPKNKAVAIKDIHFNIVAIEAEFPLCLSEIDFKKRKIGLSLNDGIVAKIQDVIKNYAVGIEEYDSLKTYKDTYLYTLQLRDSLNTIFLVLVRHYALHEVHSLALFYNNQTKTFADTSFDFKLYALYHYDDDKAKFTPTTLKSYCHLDFPEIERIDFNKDGINDYKFTRLWHNGSFNAIHTIILSVKNNKLDTLLFEKEVIRDDRLRYE